MVLKRWMYQAFIISAVFALLLLVVMLVSNFQGMRASERQAHAYAPAVAAANGANRAVLNAGYNFRTYQFSFDKKVFDEGMKALDDLDREVANLETLARQFPDALDDVVRDIDEIKKMAREFRNLSVQINTQISNSFQARDNVIRLTGLVNDLFNEYWGDTILTLAHNEVAAGDKPILTRRVNRFYGAFAMHEAMGRARMGIYGIWESATAESRQRIAASIVKDMNILTESMAEINRTARFPYLCTVFLCPIILSTLLI